VTSSQRRTEYRYGVGVVLESLLRLCCFAGVPRQSSSTASTTICPTAVYIPTKQILLSATSSLRTVHLENPVRLGRAVRELPNLASGEHLFATGMYIITQVERLGSVFPTYPVRDSSVRTSASSVESLSVRLSSPKLTAEARRQNIALGSFMARGFSRLKLKSRSLFLCT